MELSPSTNAAEPGPWDASRGRLLLRIARESLAVALHLGKAGLYEEEWLRELGATFVTLTREGKLRGCVGTLQACRSLYDDIWANARAAAFRDTRFQPLVREEYPEISVEVSLLSVPEPLPPYGSEEEALRSLRPGIDGLILEAGYHRSTFLPQVWEQLPDPREFLGQLKKKAGLHYGFWSPEVRLHRYTVMKWAEEPDAVEP